MIGKSILAFIKRQKAKVLKAAYNSPVGKAVYLDGDNDYIHLTSTALRDLLAAGFTIAENIEDPALPTNMVKGIAVQFNWQVRCNVYNITETMEQIAAIKSKLEEDPKVTGLCTETRIILGNGTSMPIKNPYYCEQCHTFFPTPHCPICNIDLYLMEQEDA